MERRPGPDTYILRKLESKGQQRCSFRETSLGGGRAEVVDRMYNLRKSQHEMESSGSVPIRLYSRARVTLPLGEAVPGPTEYEPRALSLKPRTPAFGFTRAERATDNATEKGVAPNPLTYQINDDRAIGYVRPVKLTGKIPTKTVAFGTVFSTFGVKRTRTADERRRERELERTV